MVASFCVFPIGRAEENAFVVPRVDCKARAYGEVEKVAGSREPLVYTCGGAKIPLTQLEGYVLVQTQMHLRFV